MMNGEVGYIYERSRFHNQLLSGVFHNTFSN